MDRASSAATADEDEMPHVSRKHREQHAQEVPPGFVPPMSPADVAAVEAILGYEFRDKGLVEEALTHDSFYCPYPPGETYERLEYLGDGVLTCVVSWEVFRTYQQLQPGPLTLLRAANVDKEKLARAAVEHGLYRFLRHKAPLLNGQYPIPRYPIRVARVTRRSFEAAKRLRRRGGLKAAARRLWAEAARRHRGEAARRLRGEAARGVGGDGVAASRRGGAADSRRRRGGFKRRKINENKLLSKKNSILCKRGIQNFQCGLARGGWIQRRLMWSKLLASCVFLCVKKMTPKKKRLKLVENC